MATSHTGSAWKVETVRLTTFPAVVADFSSTQWWQRATGDPPESRTIQPRLGALHEIGPIKGGLCNLSLECQPQRVDWLFSPIIEDPVLTEFPTFSDLPGALDVLKELLDRWLPESPSTVRLAFGAVLIQPTESKNTGYELLKRYLPAVQLDPDNSSDFTYQINRARASKSIKNLAINRLSKWSAIRLSGMMVQLGTAEGQPAAKILHSGRELSACRLELDLNTSPNFEGTLPMELLRDLVDELIALGVEITVDGDRP